MGPKCLKMFIRNKWMVPRPKNSETFVRAPKRRTEPSYYEIVTDPIDMLRIQQKLKMDEYTNMEELKADFELLFKNALSYYKKGTQEFKDATEMGELFAKALGRLVGFAQKGGLKQE